MNFLSHDWLLGDGLPPLAHVGASLPDLWPLLPVRPLPLLVLRRLRASGERDAGLVAYGIAHHLHADKAFHGHPEFERRMAMAAPRLRRPLAPMRHLGLAAHILVEMLLDRWLIERQPGVLDRYYDRFSDVSRRRASDLAHAGPDGQDALAGVLERFAAARFLSGYTSWEGLAQRLVRTLVRIRVVHDAAVDLDSLATEIAALHAELLPGSGDLLDDVGTRLAASLDRAGVARPVPTRAHV
jgi:hypothetical protein